MFSQGGSVEARNMYVVPNNNFFIFIKNYRGTTIGCARRTYNQWKLQDLTLCKAEEDDALYEGLLH